MKSVEFLKKFKEDEKLSFRKMAKQAGTSEAYWHQIFDQNRPPTLQKADGIARGMGIKRDTFLHIVFRDRMLKFLEKHI